MASTRASKNKGVVEKAPLVQRKQEAKKLAETFELLAFVQERKRGTSEHEVLIEWASKDKKWNGQGSVSTKRLVSWHPMVNSYTLLHAWTVFLSHRSLQPFGEDDAVSEEEEGDEDEADEAHNQDQSADKAADVFPPNVIFAPDRNTKPLVFATLDDLEAEPIKSQWLHVISEDDTIPPLEEDQTLKEDEARKRYYNKPSQFAVKILAAYELWKMTGEYRQVLHPSMIAARHVDRLHTDLPTRTIINKSVLPAEMVFQLDVEWHNSSGEHMSQLALLSSGGVKMFNRYIRYPYELHPNWRTLLDCGQVSESPWDSLDEEVCGDRLTVLQALFDFLPYGAVIYTFGVVDGNAIMAGLKQEPEKQRKPIELVFKMKGLRFVNGRIALGRFIKHYQLQLRISMSNEEGAMGKLHNVYKAMFHASLLFAKFDRQLGSFFVPPAALLIVRHALQLDRQCYNVDELLVHTLTAPPLETALLSTTIWELPEAPDHPMKCEFWAIEHLQPIYHKAHTDNIIWRQALTAMMLFMQLCQHLLPTVGPLSKADLDSGCFPNRATHVFFYLMTAVSTQHTLFYRQAHLGMNHAAALWLYQCEVTQAYGEDFYRLEYNWARSQNKRSKSMKKKKAAFTDPSLLELDVGLYVHIAPEDAIQPKKKDKKVKSASKDVSFYDDLYDPSSKGQNKALVNTMITLIEQATGTFSLTGEPVVDVHEKRRKQRGLPPIGDRPWYYFPARIGKHEPDTIMLHCQHCKNLSDGQNRLRTRGSNTIALACIEFDILKKHQLPTQRRIFCKECKHYVGEKVDISNPSRTSHNYKAPSLN